MSEYKELKKALDELKAEMKANTHLTQEGFNLINGRVKKLELDAARREGRDSVLNTQDLSWKKVTMQLLTILTTASAIAYLIAQYVLK